MDPLDKFTYEAARSIPNSDLVDLRKEIADLKTKPGADIEDLFYKKAKALVKYAERVRNPKEKDALKEYANKLRRLLIQRTQEKGGLQAPEGTEPPVKPSSAQSLKDLISEYPEFVKNAPNSIGKKYQEVLSQGEKQTIRNLLSGNIGKAATADMSLAEGLAKSVAPGIAGLVEAIPPMTKYAGENPTASLAETALSPEGSKGIARGVGASAGMEAGTYLGGLSPVAKGPAMFAGAIAGMAAGAKLADLLTGIPSIDKAIRALYEKELRKREDKMMAETESSSYLKNPRMADAAPRNMELRPGQ